MARPRKIIDKQQVELLAGCGCTTAEIAAKLDCSKDTLERRFAANIEKGRCNGHTSLRGKQFELAMKGNVTMLVWLGKQLLGQRDSLDVRQIPDDQLLRMIGLMHEQQGGGTELTEAEYRREDAAPALDKPEPSAVP